MCADGSLQTYREHLSRGALHCVDDRSCLEERNGVFNLLSPAGRPPPATRGHHLTHSLPAAAGGELSIFRPDSENCRVEVFLLLGGEVGAKVPSGEECGFICGLLAHLPSQGNFSGIVSLCRRT